MLQLESSEEAATGALFGNRSFHIHQLESREEAATETLICNRSFHIYLLRTSEEAAIEAALGNRSFHMHELQNPEEAATEPWSVTVPSTSTSITEFASLTYNISNSTARLHIYMNFSGLLVTNFLNTSTCLLVAFNFASSFSVLSIRRSPSPNNTV